MNELLEKHEIDDSFYIYLQANSTVWLARFKIGGKWISRTTKQRDKAKAIMAAVRVKTECDIKHDNGIAIQTKAFKQVAELAITRMQETPKGAKGQGSFKDYEWFLRKYHIPFFDRTHITSIDQVKLAEFDRWREKTLGRAPSQSTLKSHNVALQRVFDEAVIRRWMTESQVPSLTTTGGAAGTRRDYFTAQEVQKIADAFPEWIRNSRNRAVRDVRQLLYTYFQFAVHTGLRPGTEMDNLRWNDIELKEDHVVIIVRKGKTTLYTGSRKAIGHSTVREMVLDMHERSLDDEKLDEILVHAMAVVIYTLPASLGVVTVVVYVHRIGTALTDVVDNRCSDAAVLGVEGLAVVPLAGVVHGQCRCGVVLKRMGDIENGAKQL